MSSQVGTENLLEDEIYQKLSNDRDLLYCVAEKFGKNEASEEALYELIKFLKTQDKQELKEAESLCSEELKLDRRLNQQSLTVLRVIARDLGVGNYGEQEQNELIQSIKSKGNEAVSEELEKDWGKLFGTLKDLGINACLKIANKLAIENYTNLGEDMLIENILYLEQETINKTISRYRIIHFLSFYGLLLGIVGSVATIAGVNYRDIIEIFSSTTTTSLMTTSSTSSSIPPTTSTTIPRPERNHDSFATEEAEKFFSAVGSALKSNRSGVYDKENLPPGFSRKSDAVVYDGNLTVDKNGISGKIKFSHIHSENTFTLDQNGVISPKAGDEEDSAGITFVWVPGGCFRMGL